MKQFIKIFIVYLLLSNICFADEVWVFDFTQSELSELQVRKVRGANNKTIYSVEANENVNIDKRSFV